MLNFIFNTQSHVLQEQGPQLMMNRSIMILQALKVYFLTILYWGRNEWYQGMYLVFFWSKVISYFGSWRLRKNFCVYHFMFKTKTIKEHKLLIIILKYYSVCYRFLKESQKILLCNSIKTGGIKIDVGWHGTTLNRLE